MPFYDLTCPQNHEQIDIMLKLGERPPCPTCGEPTSTLWKGKTAGVIPDDIPGGVLIYHGLCNPDGSPRKYYSKSEIAKEADRRGLRHHVEHVTSKDTDKNQHTTRWV